MPRAEAWGSLLSSFLQKTPSVPLPSALFFFLILFFPCFIYNLPVKKQSLIKKKGGESI